MSLFVSGLDVAWTADPSRSDARTCAEAPEAAEYAEGEWQALGVVAAGVQEWSETWSSCKHGLTIQMAELLPKLCDSRYLRYF